LVKPGHVRAFVSTEPHLKTPQWRHAGDG
jgi:hypothetical protein